MTIAEALKHIQEDKPIIISGKTFIPESWDEVKLDSGESVYWIRDGGDLWLSLDPDGEEAIIFNDIEEEMDASEDLVIYSGDDYEFSYGATGRIIIDEEASDEVSFREFEADGRILRVTEYAVTGDTNYSIGIKASEEDFQEV